MWVCQNCGATNPDNSDLVNTLVNESRCGFCGASRYIGRGGGGCAYGLGKLIAIGITLLVFITLCSILGRGCS
jgi:hypothetical protein